MLDVDMPSLLRPRRKPPRADDDGATTRALTCALAGVSNLLVFAFVSLLGPFYPPFALQHLEGASNFTVGLVFACYPLAQIVTTPFGSALCQNYGRLNTCVWGLWMVAAGGLLFGLGGSIGWHMTARLMEGAGGGLVNVAAFALVMEVSESSGTLTRDVGVQEVLTGVGFIAGPATAGLLFPALGLKGMMLVLSLLPLVLGGALLALLAPRGVGRRRVVFAPFPAAAEHDHGHGDEFAAGTLAGLSSGRRFSSSVWWWDATVLLVVAALVGDAAALGFLDPTLSRHLQSLLGLGVRQMGLVFALTPFIYSTTALLVQPLSDRWGHKHIIAGGLLCVGLAFLGLGPVPLPLAAVPSAGPLGDEQQQVPLGLAWALVLVCLAFIGLGSAFVIVPACPLLLDRLDLQRPGEDFKDRVSALYTLSWSVGDALGPFLGGVLTQLLPSTSELRCSDGGGTVGCVSAFRWSSAVFGLAVLGIWVAFLMLVQPDVFAAAEAAASAEEGVGSPAAAAAAEDGERARLLGHHAHQTDGSMLGGVGQYHSISHKNVNVAR